MPGRRHRLTYDRLITVFDAESILRPPTAAIPEQITHAGTRDFLTEVGLPTETSDAFVTFDQAIRDGMRTLREEQPEEEEHGQERPELRDAFYLGDAWGAIYVAVCLDGESGRVIAVPEGGIDPYLMNSDIESLVFYLYTLERHKTLYSDEYDDEHRPRFEEMGTDTFTEAAKVIERDWREHDAAPLDLPPGEKMRVWVSILDDIIGGECG